MSLIKTQNKIKTMQEWDILQIVCSDRGALYDIHAWCKVNGYEVLRAEKITDYKFIFEIKD